MKFGSERGGTKEDVRTVMPKEDALYSTSEAACYLGVSRSTIYRMEQRGVLSPEKAPQGRGRFRQQDLDRLLRRGGRLGVSSIAEGTAPYEVVSSVEPYFQQGLISIYNADFLKIGCLEDATIDLIVTSPPYNVGVRYRSHDDRMSYDGYLRFTREWLAKCYGLAKEDGRLCLNIPLDKNKGGQQSVCADITTIAKEVGWRYHATIIWNEQNISRRTAWGSWLSASAPYVIAPVEVIVVLYKNRWKKSGGDGRSDITKAEFMEWTNAVWTFSGESRKRVGHPAPFPVELPRRCIKLFTFVGDTVLDPFLGSGSTLIACALTDRKGIGVEIDRNYCDIAKQRLMTEARIHQLKLNMVQKASR